MSEVLKRPSKNDVNAVVFELLNGATKMHLAHLQTKSYAAHKAMNKFYDAVTDLADDIAEQYQGVTEKLLTYPTNAEIPLMTNISDCINYLRQLYAQVDACHKSCSYSEIQNILDEVKSLIASTKYKLIFLS